ncbi:solute carrier family 35 member G1-like [Centruroides sculpturatus]|uniref:solute carrier family 35 member G1-like n=1 Tax=Centruroides sculpturatus TaxID=218467 RepID=UPI000C6EDE64|nr:solute carrier family 35 member G1-like [Centruroides sculpturatus]
MLGSHDENNHSNEKNNGKKNFIIYKGLIYTCASSIFTCFTSVIAKFIKEINPSELSSIKFLSSLIFSLPLIIYFNQTLLGPRKVRLYLLIGGVVGAPHLVLVFMTLQFMPLADASVILSSTPVFVGILAKILLKESFGIFNIIALLLSILGILLITKVPLLLANRGFDFGENYVLGVFSALGSTLINAGLYILVRKIKEVHHSVVMFNVSWVSMILCLMLSFFFGGFTMPQCGLNQWLVILLGVSSFVAQCLLTLALQNEHAASVSILRSCIITFLSFIFQIIIFNDIPDACSLSGAFVILISITLTIMNQWLKELPDNSEIKKKLPSFLIR